MSAGQKSASTTFARPIDEISELPLQPLQLRRDDRDPCEHSHEHDEVRRSHVLPLRRRRLDRGQGHVKSSRSSRRCESMRFPASSTPYSVAKRHSIAAHATQNVRNCECAICGPCEVKTVGCTRLCESLIARNDTGTSTTPKSAYTALMLARGTPGSTENRSMKYAQ